MAKNLVIVESPAKAKTIEKILGSDFKVTSSYGHMRDLPKKGMSIDIANHFEPTYEIPEDKKQKFNELKKAAKASGEIWLATDEDREGEAIAWHLCQGLGLDESTTKRIVFHEITKPAIEAAIKSPRAVDKHLVDAQQARRVLDRLVGYELSPVLWKKVKTGLSAGRVQSVAVRLIVEREREIENFEPVESYKVKASFKASGKEFEAELTEKLDSYETAKNFLNELVPAKFSVKSLLSKPGKKSPPAPFTTSTLQQTASTKLGFSVKQTMVLAQKLYEAGKITYMRTDSLNLAEGAIKQAASVVTERFGEGYLKSRRYKTKTSGAQEAHEAIRPTDFKLSEAGSDSGQQKLYQLIYRRALASQMADASTKKTEVEIASTGNSKLFKASGEIVEFAGWLKLYADESKPAANILPPLKEGQELAAQVITAIQVFSKPKPRYTEASLVKKLEALGIGRPSTYAPTISTIQTRGYVERGQGEGEERTIKLITLKGDSLTETTETETTGTNKGRLIPTDVGSVVTDFLVKHFPEVVDYKFTASVEDEFDKIARGETKWNAMIENFYGGFHKTVEKSETISRHEAIQARVLGKDPKTGKPVIARLGRYGAMVQIGEAEDEEKPQFASIPQGKKMSDITFEEAMELFSLPRTVGETPEGEEITANFGPYGPYVKFGKTYVSIKPESPFNITLAKAQEFIAAKKEQDANKYIKKFTEEGIEVINGRYGPYVTNGKVNARVPKDQEPKEITLEQAQELLQKAPSRRRRRKA